MKHTDSILAPVCSKTRKSINLYYFKRFPHLQLFIRKSDDQMAFTEQLHSTEKILRVISSVER